MNPTERNIIVRLRNNDREAFQLVYWKYQKAVYGLALRYLKDPQLAEDAVQDVFVKLWMNRAELDSERSLHGWLFTSLKNHVLNMIKSRKRRIERHYEYIQQMESSAEASDSYVIQEEMEQLLRKGMERLPERKQLIYRLKSLDGLTNRQIAVRLGLSINTVKSQFNRANKFIRDFIATHTNLF